MWTDASGTRGQGAFFTDPGASHSLVSWQHAFSKTLSRQHREKDINFKAMHTVLLAIQRWLPHFKLHKLVIFTDNATVYHSLRRRSRAGSCHGPPSQNHTYSRQCYGLSWARQVGIPDEDIQLLGRWKSSAYKRYIEVHPEHIFNVSRRLQTTPGPPRTRPTRSPPTEHWETPTGGIPESSRRQVGGVGRAGRGTGEPGPASGVAAPSMKTACAAMW